MRAVSALTSRAPAIMVSVPDVIEAFPDPAKVRIADISDRFGCGYGQATKLRVLAARRVAENRLMAKFDVSREFASEVLDAAQVFA